jgi:hypothetical protein
MLFRPGEVIVAGPDYDIVAGVKPNGKLLCIIRWKKTNDPEMRVRQNTDGK